MFCVYAERDLSRANILDVDKWDFYVVSTEKINRQLGSQKSAALSTIRSLASPVGYTELSQGIRRSCQ